MSMSRGAMMVTWMTGVPKKVGRSAQEILFLEIVSSGLADDCIWMEREGIEGDPQVSGGWWCHLKGLKKKSKRHEHRDWSQIAWVQILAVPQVSYVTISKSFNSRCLSLLPCKMGS